MERQACLQSNECRPGRRDALDREGLGLAGAMGERRVRRVFLRLPRRARGPPCRSKRRHLRIPSLLRQPGRRPVLLARRAARHPGASSGERRLSPLRLLHDLGSEDHPRLARRAGPVRSPGGVRGVVRPVPSVPDQRPDLVAGRLLSVRPGHRPLSSRGEVSLVRGRPALPISN